MVTVGRSYAYIASPALLQTEIYNKKLQTRSAKYSISRKLVEIDLKSILYVSFQQQAAAFRTVLRKPVPSFVLINSGALIGNYAPNIEEAPHAGSVILSLQNLQLRKLLRVSFWRLFYIVFSSFRFGSNPKNGTLKMSGEPSSPKRRHILSSINPDDPPTRSRRKRSVSLLSSSARDSRSPRPEEHEKATGSREKEGGDDVDKNTKPRRSRLKLKGEKQSHRSRDGDDYESSSRRESHRHRHHHHRHRRRHRSPTPPNPYEAPPLDPDAAFRESLFDAMADDEGASYWEGVYGQPVHVYSADRVGASGELERMTDEEYTAHVRRKMWEKTHAGLLEERARRDAERKRKQEEEKQRRKLDDDMERSLRRGDERRRRRRWVERWAGYIQAWADWDGDPEKLAWPVEGGNRRDINEKEVRAFFISGLNLEDIGESAFASKLKEERVRWHPDKIQQRLGGKVADQVIKDVTAIFQIVDRLWIELRPKA